MKIMVNSADRRHTFARGRAVLPIFGVSLVVKTLGSS